MISLPANAPDKPYKAKRGSFWVTQVRVGTTTRAAIREEEDDSISSRDNSVSE